MINLKLLPLNGLRSAHNALIAAGRAAWKQGLMCGYSGNLSMRIDEEHILITSAGCVKGLLKSDNFSLVSNSGEVLGGASRPSSEMALHLAIYAALPLCKAILHTHPAHLQALEMRGEKDFPKGNLFEADYWLQRLAHTPDFPPGDVRLGQACVAQLKEKPAPLPRGAWLSRHGLCAMGANIQDCLAFTEEMEHLARVQLLAAHQEAQMPDAALRHL